MKSNKPDLTIWHFKSIIFPLTPCHSKKTIPLLKPAHTKAFGLTQIAIGKALI